MSRLLKNQRLLLPLSLALLSILLAVPCSLRFSTNPLTVLMNLLLLLPLFGLFLALTRRTPFAFLLTALVFLFISYIDDVVYKSRLIHLRFTDFLTAGDGLRVANRYSLAPTFHTFLLLAVLLASFIALYRLRKTLKTRYNFEESRRENLLVGLALCLCSSLVILGGTKFNLLSGPYSSVRYIFDTNYTTEHAGLLYALYGEYLDSKLIPPDNYSDEAAEAVLAQYTDPASENPSPKSAHSADSDNNQPSDSKNNSSTAQAPLDLIVIMNESLADYALVGDPLFETDPLKNLHSEKNSYFEGKLVVPVFGGGTANSEFEFLTGNSMHFLPALSSPFSQYLVKPTSSLASDLSQLNFHTVGIHPYYSEEWSRKTVYPNLGFQETIFGEDFSSGLSVSSNPFTNSTSMYDRLDFGDNLEYLRGFISDAECYRKILSLLNSSASVSASISSDSTTSSSSSSEFLSKTSNFIFAVTIQNHGSYDYDKDDFSSTEYLPDNPTANQYLTLSSLSDQAFHDFISELKSRKKHTLVLMFGDHQPALETADLVSDFDESVYNYYITPYIVWSNFDLAVDFPEITSTNYLSVFLKQSANLPLTTWDNFRLATLSNYPLISTYYALDRSDNLSSRTDSPAALSDYSLLTYYRLFVEPK
ncbi:LTA synthase family protein [Candidatus Saccharibacteria bacterium]|nr:LTA synthase family protein [Candidatus Saccharibacteria bacterium]